MVNLITATLAITGGITFYYGDLVEGQPLSCPGHTYAKETGPWLAVDTSWYADRRVLCGDLFLVTFADGSHMHARALDAGYLDEYTIWDTGLPFVADLPRYWRDGRPTATGRIINLSAIIRAFGASWGKEGPGIPTGRANPLPQIGAHTPARSRQLLPQNLRMHRLEQP